MTAEVTPPRLSVDEEGYWVASYDGGDTWERITNAAGEPVKAVTDDGSSIQDSFFSAVTQDDGNVYFTLTDGFLPDPAQGSRCGTLRLRRDQDL